VQLTESAGVVDVDDEFSWCQDFNRGRCRGDEELHCTFCIFIFIFILVVFVIRYKTCM